MDVYVNISDRSEIATSFESRNTTSRTVKSSYNFSASMGTSLEWSAVSQPTAEEVEEGSHDAVPLVFLDFNLDKTREYRRNLQLEDAERQSVLLVVLVNSSVRAVVTGRPGIFGARDSQPLHVVVQGRAFHPQTGCSAVRARDDAVRLF
jgi:hypothetical protein